MDKEEVSQTVVSPRNYDFQLSVAALETLVEAYIKRDFCEDVEILKGDDYKSIDKALQTDFKKGLKESDNHKARIEVYGSNKKPEPELTSYLRFCLEALSDQIMIILSILGVVSLIIGATGDHPEYGWVEGFAILCAVAIVVFVSSTMNYSKQNKFKELQDIHKNRSRVSVLREGDWKSLHPEEILVGDIINLQTGDIVPADGIVISCSSLQVNEAALTGENDLMIKETIKECNRIRRKIKKSHSSGNKHDVPSPVIISGSTVAQGMGVIVAIAVGTNSKEGRISDLAEQEEEETPLENKLNEVAEKITFGGLLAGLIALVSLYLRYFIRLGMGTAHTSATELIGYFLIAFTVIAVAVPEGLPLAVTISLAYSVKKMQKDKNLVKKLAACETMGGVDMVCSDKTGTLTQNHMVLNRFSLGISTSESNIYEYNYLQSLFSKSPEFFKVLKEGISLATTARVEQTSTGPKDVGSQTELAIIKMLISISRDEYLNIRKDYELSTLKYNPFSSERKRSSIIVKRPDDTNRIYVIGAPDFLINCCTDALNLDMNKTPIGELESLSFIATQEKMASLGLRTLSIAYRDLDENEPLDELDKKGHPVLENAGLTILGIFGIYDPPREGVESAIKTCKTAGIRVRMITGDNAKTAEAIAKQIGITTGSEHIMEGPTFEKLVGGVMCEKCETKICDCPRRGEDARNDVIVDMEKFKEIIGNIDVLARSSPEDKYTMVTGLKKMGHVVAVTGDGTNDAPALRKANVGFAMGIAGTEYARQAADIILIDDNFSSIVRAAVWGRSIYDNIQRFIQFQLTVNVVAVICSIVGAITIQQSALTAVQMLWVNMIMDALASLALSTEEPSDAVLDRAPQNPNEFIVTPLMFKHIFGQAFCQLILIFLFMFYGENIFREYDKSTNVCRNPNNSDFVCSGRLYDYGSGEDYEKVESDLGPSRHFTYIFNIFIWFQLFNEINARKIKDEVWVFEGLGRAPLFIGVWLVTAGLQVLIIQVGSWAFYVNKHGLTVEQWFTCIAWGAIPLLFRFVLLLIPGLKDIKIQEPEPSNTKLLNAIHSSSKRLSSVYRIV
jgi:P-type Ca2+ transporter type 2B